MTGLCASAAAVTYPPPLQSVTGRTTRREREEASTGAISTVVIHSASTVLRRVSRTALTGNGTYALREGHPVVRHHRAGGCARLVTVATLSLDRVRAIALALPDVTEQLSHGATCFFVRDKRPLCYFHDHHNDGRVSLWCPAGPGVQEALVASEPTRFFKPPTSASGTFSDWVGVFLDDADVDWDEIAEILEDAFRVVAPATAVAELDAR